MFDALFRNTLTPWQWLLLGLIPPAIVALYFLKLKRMPLEVPSTYLWKKSIEDLHVNSLWQRIRQNLLMYLQLLLVALAILALLRPGWQGTDLEGTRFIFLVDNSASMQSTDVAAAESRLEEAKHRTRDLIGQLESGMTAMIISFADSPRVVQEFTDNHRLLRERLDTIQPTYGTTDLKGALELANGLANPGKVVIEEMGIEADIAEAKEATVFIFSDGRFEDVEGFSLGNLTAIYAPVGSLSAENLAITALATRRGDVRPEERQAFVQVANLTGTDQSVEVVLTLDNQFLDAQGIDVPAGVTNGAVFPLANAPAGALRARLRYELGTGPTDALPLDDNAYAALNDALTGRVLVVTPGNPLLETALATERSGRLSQIELQTPDYLTGSEYDRLADTGQYDLVIYDQCTPERMPRANTLFVGRLPLTWQPTDDEAASAAGEDPDSAETPPDNATAAPPPAPQRIVVPQIIDWNRSHPLMAYVELGSVAILDSLLVEPPPGGDSLIDATAGPIAAVAPRDSYQDVVLGFEITGKDDDGRTTINTNWPRRHSFPTFWLNALEYLAGREGDLVSGGVQPGEPVELKIPGAGPELVVVDPDGKSTTLYRDRHDIFQFHDTQHPGVYEVRDAGNVRQRFAVNLFDREESDVRVRPSQDPEAQAVAAGITIGNIDVAAVSGSAPARKELWKLLLVAALVVLLVEWYIYNRRVYV